MPRFLTAKFIRITWPFFVIMVLMLGLSIGCMEILSAVRAYVGGEGLWSKGQKDAVMHLTRYARLHDPTDYARYREALAVPLGDHTARIELQKPQAEFAVARDGFLAGRNHADDVMPMIWLFRSASEVPFMKRAIAVWTEGDRLIAQLDGAAKQIHAEIQSGDPNQARLSELLGEVERVNRELRPLEDEFSATLGDVSRLVTTLLLWTLTAAAALFLVVGALISQSMLRQSERVEQALLASESGRAAERERAQVTLGSIRDGVISTDDAGRVEYLNAAAATITGWTQSAAKGQLLHTVFRLIDQEGSEPLGAHVMHLLNHGGAIEPFVDAVLIRRDGKLVPVDESIAPIHDREGRIAGVVAAFRDVSQERALSEQLLHQATHDSLTGLANRREFETRLQAALAQYVASGRHFTVLYLDLDQFKVVNDTCGHPAGDELIRQVAERVDDILRGTDLLARLGGDEFGVLLADCLLADGLKIAEKICSDLADLRFAWRDRSFVVSASVGAVALEANLRSVADVLAAADSACYLSKDAGRNRVTVYRPDDSQVQARTGEMEWVTRVARALEIGSFELHAQEIRPLAAGRDDSRYEILLRLVDERGALVLPMAFIPAAERYGMMNRVDAWVIERTFSELGAFVREGGSLPIFVVNLSGSSLADPGLLPLVKRHLDAARLPPERICFELTETAAVSNLAGASRLMRDLKALGCHLALDDFGSGMSSFAYLRNLPVDFLKIDGNFVKDMHVDLVDRAMVASIHNVGRVMGLRTIAEWVENEAIVAELSTIGIDYAQGYAIAHPVPLNALLRQLALASDRKPVRLVHSLRDRPRSA